MSGWNLVGWMEGLQEMSPYSTFCASSLFFVDSNRRIMSLTQSGSPPKPSCSGRRWRAAEGMGIVAFHPDGRRIAFESGYGGVEANELWVLESTHAAVKSKKVSAAK